MAHALKHAQGRLPLAILSAGGDGRAAGNDMDASRGSAASPWPPFSQAPMATLQVMALGQTRSEGMDASRERAPCH